MNRFLYSIFLVTVASASHAVEFEDYNYEQWSQSPTQCDHLAAHGRDPGAVAPHVSRSDMDLQAAIRACQEALKSDPDNPRLNYQLARAYGYSGNGELAMPYRNRAVDADYPQSTFVIGYIALLGQTMDQDRCLTLDLWQRSARYRRLAALVSLPRHYIDGDFDECGTQISPRTLRAYLTEAKRISDDYYVNMLADEILARIPEPKGEWSQE